jgi:hypothetical protein
VVIVVGVEAQIVPDGSIVILGVTFAFTVTATDEEHDPTVYVTTDVPGVTPVTRPLLFTVATDGVALLHVPPGVASLNVVDDPAQILVVPVIAASDVKTFNVEVDVQLPITYVIAVLPAAIPVTVADVPLLVIVAIVVLPLLYHVPPGVASLKVIVEPAQTLPGPVIAAGCVPTVTVTDEENDPTVYVTTDVPAATPVTRPPLFIVATDGVALLHLPPVVASLNCVDNGAQILVVPVIAAGLTVTVILTEHAPRV